MKSWMSRLKALSQTRPTVADLRLSYSDEKRQRERRFLWVPLVRVPSFYIAWLFVRLGISADQTTVLGWVVALFGCLLLASGRLEVMFAGAILANAWFLLDCVDGSIARHHGASSIYGKFIDDLGGHFMYGLLFISAGIGQYTHQVIGGASSGLFGLVPGLVGDPAIYLVVGGLASLAAVLRTVVHFNLAVLCSTGETDVSDGPLLRSRWPFAFLLYANLTSFCGLILPLLALAVVVGALDCYLLFYSVVNLVALIFTTARLLAQARRRLMG